MKRRHQFLLLATLAVLAVAVHFVSREVAGHVFYSGPDFKVLFADGRALNTNDIQDIVKRYAAEKNADFDFSRARCFIMLTPLDTNVLATVDFLSGGFGSPMLHADIGRDGKVLRHFQGIARCGHGGN
jgi:hypothetical protein